MRDLDCKALSPSPSPGVCLLGVWFFFFFFFFFFFILCFFLGLFAVCVAFFFFFLFGVEGVGHFFFCFWFFLIAGAGERLSRKPPRVSESSLTFFTGCYFPSPLPTHMKGFCSLGRAVLLIPFSPERCQALNRGALPPLPRLCFSPSFFGG